MKQFGSKIFLIIGFFVCFATIATMAYAQEFPRNAGGRPGMKGMPGGIPGLRGLMPLLKLNLSQAQQKDLLDILDKYNELRVPYMDTMMSAGREMADILEADTLDEENARAVFRKQEAVREEMMILDIKMNNEIKGVLSSEQIELLKHRGAGKPGRPFRPQGE